jgi:hypothetical protein
VKRIFVAIAALVLLLGAATPPAVAEQQRGEDPPQAGAPQESKSTPPADQDDDTERALERILVTRGGLVLPKYSFEIEPELQFFHTGASVVHTRHDRLTSALTLRLGLPWSSQAEVRLPYVLYDETPGGTTNGLGDIAVTLTKEFLRERDYVPTLLGAVRWRAATGENPLTPTSPTTGSGFNSLEWLATAVKRHDPLVFFGTVLYGISFPEKAFGVEIKPGDVVAGKAGTILATSPNTSLSLGVTVAAVGNVSVAGRRVRDSDQLIGTVDLGLGVLLTRRTLLNVTTEIGVTKDAPDLLLSVSFPFRF